MEHILPEAVGSLTLALALTVAGELSISAVTALILWAMSLRTDSEYESERWAPGDQPFPLHQDAKKRSSV